MIPIKTNLAGPFTQKSGETVKLTNTTSTPLAYKVRTTSPKLYAVRPTSTLLQPGESIDVSIVLQGLPEEPSPDFKCKDKFLFVSVPHPDYNENDVIADIFPELESRYKSEVERQKVKVKFAIGESSTQDDIESKDEQPDNATEASKPASTDINPSFGKEISEKNAKVAALEESLDGKHKTSIETSASRQEPVSTTQTSRLPLIILIILLAIVAKYFFF
ncbi:BA75_02032T0 [Komagataella pastoris]|uniref:BA75_02032T0 n=1 Tax=Komagataella pastoris TaxID=4922 RepID=A0A1B2JAN8_PICPA|nr:BA75_02032T0 [Komagataella pastoris]